MLILCAGTDGTIFGAATKNMSAAEYVSGIDTRAKHDGATRSVPYIFHSVRCLKGLQILQVTHWS